MKVTNEILYEKLKNHIEANSSSFNSLNEKMDLGFKGVYSRQDKTNGKLLDHDKYITDLQKEDIRLNNKIRISKITWIIFGLLCSFILALAGFIISNISSFK